MYFEEKSPEELLGSLNEIERRNAPARLYFRGNTELLNIRPIVSIVGSRAASVDGLRRAGALTRSLVEQGVTILSGLAEGIDAEAHTVCIAKGGKTIGVIGTPLDKSFPAKNRALQERIATEHLLLSQFPIGFQTSRASFPQRNRTMALIADATVIIEAQDKSGSLHQGWETLRLGRPLIILESAVNDPSLSWPKEFLKFGAFILGRNEVNAFIASLPKSRNFHDEQRAF